MKFVAFATFSLSIEAETWDEACKLAHAAKPEQFTVVEITSVERVDGN